MSQNGLMRKRTAPNIFHSNHFPDDTVRLHYGLFQASTITFDNASCYDKDFAAGIFFL